MTTSALEVKTLLARKRAALREAIQSSDGRGQDPLTPEALRNALPPAGDPKAEGFLRVLYQMQSQLGAFAPAAFDANTARAQQIRVPTAGANAQQTLLFWTRFFLTQVSASAPLLLVLPLEGGWVDVTVGEPESHEFFCLRASPKAVPLVSEVPYKLDEAFRASATAFLDSFRRGEPATAILQHATALVAEPSAPARAGWLRWLGVGVIIVLAAIAAVVLWPKDTKQQTASQPQSSPVPASSPKPVVKSDTPAPAPPASDTSTAEAARAKARLEAEAEAARQVEAKKQADALAAAAKLKAAAEAAIQEKERQAAEAARLEKEKAAAAQKRLEDQQRQAADLAAAKVKSDQQAQAALQLAAIPASNTDLKPATASTSPVTPASGQITNSIGMVLVQLPSGLWVGKYEVTQAEYRKVMGANPSFWVDDRKPVEQVTWNDAVEFNHKLTELERSTLPAGRT